MIYRLKKLLLKYLNIPTTIQEFKQWTKELVYLLLVLFGIQVIFNPNGKAGTSFWSITSDLVSSVPDIAVMVTLVLLTGWFAVDIVLDDKPIRDIPFVLLALTPIGVQYYVTVYLLETALISDGVFYVVTIGLGIAIGFGLWWGGVIATASVVSSITGTEISTSDVDDPYNDEHASEILDK